MHQLYVNDVAHGEPIDDVMSALDAMWALAALRPECTVRLALRGEDCGTIATVGGVS